VLPCRRAGRAAALLLGGDLYCFAVIDAAEVQGWVSGTTALCPRCGIDAVLSARTAPTNGANRDPASLQRANSTSFATIAHWCSSIHYPVNGAPPWRQFMDKALYRAYVAMQQDNKARTFRDFGAVL